MDGGPTLASGAVVHASVRARLLGLRILRLEADVVLAPAAPVVSATPVGVRALVTPRSGGQLDDARRLLAEAEDLLDGGH